MSIRMAILLGSVVVSLAPAPAFAERASAGCSGGLGSGGIMEFADAGLTRIMRTHVGAGLDPLKPAPLVLMFHGWGEDENALLDVPVVTDQADRLGFILAAARGVGTDGGDDSYNSFSFRGSASGIDGQGAAICSGAETNYAYKSCGIPGQGIAQNGCSWTHCQSDDTTLVPAMIAKVGAETCVDLDRVFVMGTSNGGMFAWDMGQSATVAPELRAIATLIGLPHRGYLDGPGRVDGLPVLSITGQDDPTVPPGKWQDDAATTTLDGDLYHYTGARAITDVWAKAQGCSGEPSVVDFGRPGIECRSSCAADGSGLPAVLDCRAPMAHEYDLDKTWPMILEFFARQPQR